jgi:hypothetical protein
MDRKKELIERVEKLISLMNDDSVSCAHWRSWFEDALRHLKNDDSYGLTKIHSAYGGMGSFNDFAYGNQQIDSLSSDIYELTEQLRRAQNA